MDGSSRSSLTRACARVALVGVLGVAGLLAAPGTALAVGEVRPVVDCVRKNPDGSFTAVLGYTNRSSSPVTVPLGSRNKVTPAASDGRQPTTFQPGTKQGAHTVTLTSSEYSRSGGYWSIDGNVAFIGRVAEAAYFAGAYHVHA